jgi:hypothetical protein
MDKMKWLAIATAVASLMACGGGSGGSSPTARTPAPPANIAGSYNATIIASSTCSANLPSEARVLNYVANITQTGAAVQVQLSAHVIWNSVTVSGTVSGQTINFSNFSFSEITTGGGVALTATGTANVAADGSITGTLSGAYQTPAGTACHAGNHQIQMSSDEPRCRSIKLLCAQPESSGSPPRRWRSAAC